MNFNVSIVIPARISSSRLPGKMLKLLGGKPVIQHVIEHVQHVRNCLQIYVVTDSAEIATLARSLGVISLLTSSKCRSGTERIASVLHHITGDWIFNVQGDEPFIDPYFMEQLIEKTQTLKADILTPIYRLKSIEDVQNPNIVKVVCDERRNALYFSRSPIPYVRDIEPSHWLEQHIFWGHIGTYGFRRSLLEHYFDLKLNPLEQAENLEQLRFLSSGYTFATCEASKRSLAIDTLEDLNKAEKIFASHPV